MGKDKAARPITSAQRKAAERMLQEHQQNLYDAAAAMFGTRSGRAGLRLEEQARDEWMAQHPEFVEVVERAATYIERAQQHLNKLAKEAGEALGEGFQARAQNINWGSLLTPEVVHDDGKVSIQPWSERARELTKEHYARERRVNEAVNSHIAAKYKALDKATLGDLGPDLYTLDTLDVIIERLDKKES